MECRHHLPSHQGQSASLIPTRRLQSNMDCCSTITESLPLRRCYCAPLLQSCCERLGVDWPQHRQPRERASDARSPALTGLAVTFRANLRIAPPHGAVPFADTAVQY
jgi:hypothetical protein